MIIKLAENFAHTEEKLSTHLRKVEMIHQFLRRQFRIWVDTALIRYPLTGLAGISEYLFLLHDADLLKALGRKRMTRELQETVTRELESYGCKVMPNKFGFGIRLDLKTAVLDEDHIKAFKMLQRGR